MFIHGNMSRAHISLAVCFVCSTLVSPDRRLVTPPNSSTTRPGHTESVPLPCIDRTAAPTVDISIGRAASSSPMTSS